MKVITLVTYGLLLCTLILDRKKDVQTTATTIPFVPNDNRPTEGFWARWGGNVAGAGYVVANLSWMALGAATLSLREFAAGAVNLHGGLSRMFYSRGSLLGITNYGTKAGAASGLLANIITTLPDLIHGSLAAYASNVLIASSQSMDFGSETLKRRFSQSKNSLLRSTLGQPRFIGGVIRLGSRLPIIIASLAVQEWGRAAVFFLLAAADVASAVSQPAMASASPAADAHQRLDAGLARLQVIHDEVAGANNQDIEPAAPLSTGAKQTRARQASPMP